MAISNHTTKTSTPTNGQLNRTIVLKLSPKLLSRYPSDSTPKEDNEKLESSPSSPSSTSGEPLPALSSIDNASESGSTPAPTGGDDTPKLKGSPRSKTGTKRGVSQMSEGPRGSRRPGPKKRLKLYVVLCFFYIFSVETFHILISFNYGSLTLIPSWM